MCLCVGMSAAVNAVSDNILQGRAGQQHTPHVIMALTWLAWYVTLPIGMVLGKMAHIVFITKSQKHNLAFLKSFRH